jgi:hypothetical protein
MPPQKPPLKRYVDISDFRPPPKPHLVQSIHEQSVPIAAARHGTSFRPKGRIIIVLSAIVLLSIGTIGWSVSRSNSPVPQSVQRQVAFPVYYPKKTGLPAGYSIDQTSFSATKQAVVYTVSNGSQKVAFSVQALPNTTALNHFYQTEIPLHKTYNEPAGVATVGIIQNQNIVSLPTSKGAWVLITAPLSFNQATLLKIVTSVTAP